MISKQDAYRGCLLGLAIGDAMGYPVDTKTWQQIQEDYGPYGLMGYDLRNGYAEISSHTQLAAFSCNGMLLGMTRGQVYGKMAPFVRYVHLAQQEWAVGQRRYDQPGRNHFWVFRVSEMRHRHCTDTRMVETLNRSGSTNVAVAGQVRLLQQPEYQDIEKAQRMLTTLDGENLIDLPAVMQNANGTQVLVGPENVAEELKDTSVVITKFDIGDGLQGMIGVVGPTRMDYARVTARLSYFAESLSKMFGKPEQPQLPDSTEE